jgi:hypothetical protein
VSAVTDVVSRSSWGGSYTPANHFGGVDWPSKLLPQQTTVLFVRIAQLWAGPALIALKVPEGGEGWPGTFTPQQAMASSVRMPQVWMVPALMALKWPAGGEALPASFDPQQWTVSSVLMAHV